MSSDPEQDINAITAALKEALMAEAQKEMRPEHRYDDDSIPDGCKFSTHDPDWPFNQMSADYPLLACPEIDSIDGSTLTPFMFYKHYVSKNKPVVIHNAMKSWPALHKWQNNEYLKTQLDGTQITVDFTPDGRADSTCLMGNYPSLRQSESNIKLKNTNNASSSSSSYVPSLPSGLYTDLFAMAQSIPLQFNTFLDILTLYDDETIYNHQHSSLIVPYHTTRTMTSQLPTTNNNTKTIYPQDPLLTGIPYCQRQNSSFIDEFGKLHHDVPVQGFSWANDAFEMEPEAVNFWMGSSFSHTSMHQDWFENIYAVVRGEKFFTLVPPTDSYWLPKQTMPSVLWRRISNASHEGTLTVSNLSDYVPSTDNDNNNNDIYPPSLIQLWSIPESLSTLNTPTNTLVYIYQGVVYKVIDRTNGDNEEWHTNIEDLFLQPLEDSNINIDENIIETLTKDIKKNQSNTNANHNNTTAIEAEHNVKVLDLNDIDYSLSHKPYVITSQSCTVQTTDNNVTITQATSPSPHTTTTTTTTTATTTSIEYITINNVKYPVHSIIMIKKGPYVTLPVIDTSLSSSTTSTDDASSNDSSTTTTTTTTSAPPPPSLPVLSSTPWIALDVESNPIHFTPGTSRAKHIRVTNHVARYIARVKAGDVLYLPSQWYHSVRQRGVTISVNWWYPMDYDDKYVMRECIQRLTEKISHLTSSEQQQ